MVAVLAETALRHQAYLKQFMVDDKQLASSQERVHFGLEALERISVYARGNEV